MVQKGLGNLTGRFPQSLGRRECKSGGEIAVARVPGDLYRRFLDLRLGQGAVRSSRAVGRHGQSRRLVLRFLYHIRHC